MRNINVKLFKIGFVVQEMLFNDISIFSSGGQFIGQSGNHLCYFSRRHYGEHLCESI